MCVSDSLTLSDVTYTGHVCIGLYERPDESGFGARRRLALCTGVCVEWRVIQTRRYTRARAYVDAEEIVKKKKNE